MKKFLLLSLIYFSHKIVFAQSISPEIIASSGDYFTNGNNALSWTIGETVIETYSNSNNVLSQGFQQPYYLITDLNENSSAKISVTIYPNPSANFLTINFSAETKSPLTIEIIDITGNSVLKKFVPAKTIKSEIDISQFAQAVYFLKINSSEQTIVNTYKIQKIY